MEVIFLKIKAKNAGIVVTMASIFNEEIWKKERHFIKVLLLTEH